MKPYEHQIDGANEAYEIIRKYGLVYLAWEERCGKTLTAILIAEMSKAKNILVLTKKKALGGWNDTLDKYTHTKKYTVTNYHQAAKLKGPYDLIILDESHAYLSRYPRTGKIWKDVYRLTYNRVPLIYMSATPYAESLSQLFNQFRLSFWSPFANYKNFYEWHRVWGIPDKTRTPYGLVETYKKIKPAVKEIVNHLFIHKTRADLEFEHEPIDSLNYVSLNDNTNKLIKDCVKKEMLEYNEVTIPLDSPMKLRTTIYQIEGGWVYVDDNLG